MDSLLTGPLLTGLLLTGLLLTGIPVDWTPLVQEWLLTWRCLTEWPVQLVEEEAEVRPCPLICSLVQEHCPFNIIMEDASMAGGDPTFLCEGDWLVMVTSGKQKDQK